MNDIISGFIDDELGHTEKISLVKRIREDAGFTTEALTLLNQESLLRSDMYRRRPVFRAQPERFWKRAAAWIFRPRNLVPAATVGLIAVMLLWPIKPAMPVSHPQRFVLYRPDASLVEIAGSFSEWKRIPLGRIGDSGYWEVTIALPRGEHRFSYIIEGRERIPDPTILLTEDDDLGGANSVLSVETKT